MNNFYLNLLLILIFLAGCATEPRISLPVLEEMPDGQRQQACAAVFPQGNWQFVHSIEFTMKDGAGTPVIGVTTLADEEIECALVTVEGLTLFEASYYGKESFEIKRSVPPFDKPEFARGLLADIRAIFQVPLEKEVQSGHLPGGTSICRYTAPDGRVIDVLPDAGDCWQIKSYSANLILDRAVVGRSCRKKGNSLIPDSLELKRYGQAGYTLKMTLIGADTLP